MKSLKYLILFFVCFTLTSCVQETHPKKVSFKVKAENPDSTESIGIRGNLKPLSWNNTLLLEGPDADGFFTSTINFDTANNQLSFKFVRNDSIFELDGLQNRSLHFEYKPEKLEYSAVFNSPNKE